MPRRVRVFSVTQIVAPGQTEALETLPSFHYEAAEGELNADALRLPWSESDPNHAVGTFARDHGLAVPGRLIASAKSWLCHTGVDRTAALLPWHGAPDVERLSPVHASSRYLRHVREAWDHRFPAHPLAEQDIVLTLPASFDEVARELTVQAARLAGLKRVVLIEEPQAAFYAWIDAHRDNWEQHVEPGQTILVCDIGGGTSDFTLIRVRLAATRSLRSGALPSADSGSRLNEERIQFHRVAVGEHLILGGDNLDLALAHHIERKILGEASVESGARLEPRQWDVLVRTCRNVKETLLSKGAPERMAVNLPGSGSKLIGGGLQVEVPRDECREVLVEGFLPRVTLDEKPQQRKSGFQEFGLPFAADAAITRYLAAFLTVHRLAGEQIGNRVVDEQSRGASPRTGPTRSGSARPDIVLFNGGFFESPVLRQRLIDVLSSWFRTDAEPDWQPIVLRNDRLDLAVAHGAAYYGMVRRGEGVRIAAGLARTYYLGVETDGETQALCLLPAGTEPGQEMDLAGREFRLLVSTPIEFPLFVSSTRLVDRPGEVVPIDREQITPLPPIRTVLQTRKKNDAGEVRVHLHARLTEIGTLDVWCSEIDGTRSWRLQFDVRSATQTDVAAHSGTGEQTGVLDESAWRACREHIEKTFGKSGRDKPEGLAKRLARAIGLGRRDWPTSLLRGVWEMLMDFESGRRKSASHEGRWLNLVGFALRPGYGLAVDDWRVAETWRRLGGKLVHAVPACRAEWWILWRRIAGGLSPGQQTALATPLLAQIRTLHKQTTTGKGRGAEIASGTHEAAEIWRLLGALELLDLRTKIELGGMLLDLLPKRSMGPVLPALAWSLGRVAARVPVYGPLNGVVPAETVADWLRTLLALGETDPMVQLAVMQSA
ncbi:MAG: Hsp70 family protein, partial [Planctomycetaceae bacterium]